MSQILLLAGLSFTVILGGCTPSADQLKKKMEENPEIIFSAIEKNPKKFMEVVQKAAREAEAQSRQDAEKDEQSRIENEMKNPLQPVLSDDRAMKGDKDAPITIVGYSDFQCPFCSRGFQTMEQVISAYPGKVRYIHKHLPLPNHPMAMPAAKRYEAIALQSKDKALKFHDEIFKSQDKLNTQGEKFLDASAKKAGADVAKMKKDMDGKVVQSRIQADMEEAQKFEIHGTPGFIVSGVSVRGAYPFETFKEIIDKKLAAAK